MRIDATVRREAHAGRSLIEILWEELDSIMDRLMDDGAPEPPRNHNAPLSAKEAKEFCNSFAEWGEERGQAQGVAYALAIMLNPYQPNVPGVKAEAMERWEARQDEE